MEHLEAEELANTWVLFKRAVRIIGPVTQEQYEWEQSLHCSLEEFHLECRNSLMLHYSSLVRYVAAKIGGTLPAMVDRDDLVSYGMFGLMDALEKFSLDKGVKFETYGVARIRGAIYDEIRALDWVPRSVRSKARDLDRARAEMEMTLGRPAEHQEVAQNLGLTMEEYWQLTSQANVGATQIDSLSKQFVDQDSGQWEEVSSDRFMLDPTSNPSELHETGEVAELVCEAINHMDTRSKVILTLYYLQEMTLAEIGAILGVTESRVCQLQSKALLSLRESLGQGGLAA